MINFQPLKTLPQNLEGNGSFKADAENLANEKLAKQLNQMFQGKACPDHPDFESLVLINLKEDLDFLRVISCCCVPFKLELEGLAEPQKAYSTSH
ncbi:MAG: hypothetical protein ABI151_11785 [Chitinophagaceae bacterium]